MNDVERTQSFQPVPEPSAVYYLLSDGTHIGFYDYLPPYNDAVAVPAPQASDQLWDFGAQTWGPSRMLLAQIEDAWREEQILIINRQLEAIEEAEADVPPEDLLPGTRTQWLSHRGKVRAWKEGHSDFPDSTKRPARPS